MAQQIACWISKLPPPFPQFHSTPLHSSHRLFHKKSADAIALVASNTAAIHQPKET